MKMRILDAPITQNNHPKGWSVRGYSIPEDPDDEDLWQASKGEYVLDIGSWDGIYRCRVIRNHNWEEPADDVIYKTLNDAIKWGKERVRRLT